MSLEQCKAELERIKSLEKEIELKKQYNHLLERFKKGEEYFKKNGIDSRFQTFLEILKDINKILRKLPNATDEEIENGFNVPKVGVKPSTEI